jgi:hypothetical protein
VTALSGQRREVALAEAQAVLALTRDGELRDELAALVAEIDAGDVTDGAELLEQVLELGLQAGRIRAYYGPGGEQAALQILRGLPRGRARGDSARAVSDALSALAGKSLERVSISAIAPGSYTLSLRAEGLDTTIRLDATGARVVSVGT